MSSYVKIALYLCDFVIIFDEHVKELKIQISLQQNEGV
jgi:hypothetical protein